MESKVTYNLNIKLNVKGLLIASPGIEGTTECTTRKLMKRLLNTTKIR